MGGQLLGAEGRREVAVYLGGGLAEAVCLAGEVPPACAAFAISLA